MRPKLLGRITVGLVILASAGCGAGGQAPLSIRMASTAFSSGGAIPATYTCQAENDSPALSWSNLPQGTKSLALLVTDRDAKGFAHWVVYNIPPAVTGSAEQGSPEGGTQGTNGFGKAGYRGPCPPSGNHHYLFTLYALKDMLQLPDGANAEQVEQAMKGKILARGQLIGTYEKS